MNVVPTHQTGGGIAPSRGLIGGHYHARRHQVTAVVVNHDGGTWLRTTLDALAGADQQPTEVLLADTGSQDGSDRFAETHPCVDRVVRLPRTTGFGAAVARALQEAGQVIDLSDGAAGRDDETVRWIWLLHDDSAPEPDALEALLRVADQTPSATVLGPKLRGWYDRDLLVEAGVSISASGRRVTGLEPGERDQGQRDDTSDVLAVSSAGMLVRRDVWDRLGGFDSALPLFRDDVEFCWRARRADERVIVVPEAIVHHAEALGRGRRRDDVVGGDSAIADRRAAIYTLLVHSPGWRLPLTSIRLLIDTLIHAVAFLVGRAPRRAWGEITAWVAVHTDLRRIRRSRRELQRVATLPDSETRDLRPGAAEQFLHWSENLATQARGRGRPGHDRGPIHAGVAVALFLGLLALAFAATRPLWSGSGELVGGALLPAPGSVADLWSSFRAGWHDVGLGSSVPAAPYLLSIIGVGLLPAMGPGEVVSLLLLLGVPLAGLSAFLSLRGAPVAVRGVLAVCYALLPAALNAPYQGRLGSATVAILLPIVLRLGLRLVLARPGDDRAPGRLAPAGARTAALAAFLFAVVVSFAPILWPAGLLALLIGAITGIRTLAGLVRVICVAVAPLVLLWPWSGRLFVEPERILFEAGLPVPTPVAEVPMWRLLFLDPGGSGSDSAVLGLLLVIAALAALIPRRTRPVVVTLWTVATGAFLLALLQTRLSVVPPGGVSAGTGYAGPLSLLMGAVLIAAIAWSLAGRRAPVDARSWGWAWSAAVALLLLLGPVTMAALWIVDADGPVRRSEPVLLPAFVAENGISDRHTRALLLASDPQEGVRFTVLNGAGPSLGDGDVLPPAQTYGRLAEAVAALAAGVGGPEVGVLADHAIGYLLADAGTDLAKALDASPGLVHISTADGRGLWQVAAEVGLARLTGPEATTIIPVTTEAQDAPLGTMLDVTIPAASVARDVHLAVGVDPGWEAATDGEPLVVRDESGLISVALPAGSEQAQGRLVIAFDQRSRDLSLLVPLVGLLLVAVFLVPSARRTTVADPEVDAPGPASGDIEVRAAFADVTDAAMAQSPVQAGEDSVGADMRDASGGRS